MDDDKLVLQQVVGINPSISVSKTANVVNADGSDDPDDVIDSAGDTILYTISVTNTGDTTLTNPVLIDPFLAASLDKNGDGVIDAADITGGDVNGNGELDLGETWTWEGSYQVTQADIDNRGNYDSPVDADSINDKLIRNVVSVSTDQGATEDAQFDTTLDYDPQLRVAKTADVLNADGSDDTDNIIDTAGDVIDYTVRVSNIGNVSLLNFQLTEGLVPTTFDVNGDGLIDARDVSTGDDGNGVLDVGEEWVFRGTYQVTQEDIDNRGNFDGPDGDTLNDNIIRNTVNVTTQTVDQNVSGVGDANVEVDYRPVILIEKGAILFNPDGSLDEDGAIDQAGEVIQYSLSARNAGNVTLSNVSIVDPLIATSLDKNGDGVIDVQDSDGGDANGNGLLDVGEAWLFSGEYQVKQSDIDQRGNYDGPDPDTLNDNFMRNFAGVTSLATDGQQITRDTFVDTRIVEIPVLTVDKVFLNVTGGNGNELADADGDVLNYRVVVTNSGNVTLTEVSVTDPLTGQNLTGLTLAPGESQEFLTSYTLKQADLDNNGGGDGDIDNTVTADSLQTEAAQASAEAPIVYSPMLAVDKVFLNVTGGNGNELADADDDVLNYRVVVTNSGNVTLTEVSVTDPLTGQNLTGLTLAPGESQEFLTSYTLKQADLDNNGGGDGDIDNTVTADSLQTEATQASAEAPIVYSPDLDIEKTADVDQVSAVGDLIHYTIAVSNAGNITLSNIQVTDTLIQDSLAPRDLDMDGVIDGDLDADGLLDVGETWYWKGQYQVTAQDYEAAMSSMGSYWILNTATADSDQTDPESDTEEVELKVEQAFEGLSPGYWKNHPGDWDGVATSMSFEEFFFGSQQPGLNWKVMAVNGGGKERFSTNQDITLMQALELTGGDAAALARSAVAAVLNVRDEDVTYQFSESQIKTWVTDALSGQPVDLDDDGTFEFAAGKMAVEGVKDLLDYNNNLGLS